MSTIIDRILAEVCLDERIPDGTFDMSNNTHMDVLRENLTDNYGLALNDVKGIHNKMVEGKYPERQAYNKDGLLVTFPTPQHKAKAISRGTHFEQDPSKGPQNVFGGGQQPPGGQPPAGGAPPPAGAPPAGADVPQQNVFTPPTPEEQPPAGGAPSAPPAAGGGGGSQLPPSDTPPQAAPQAAPAGQSAPSSLPASEAPPLPNNTGLAVEPQAAPAAPGTPQQPAPPPNFDTPKSPQQRAAEAQAVKQIMKGSDTNPSLLPSLTEQFAKVEKFCERENLSEALEVIRHMKTVDIILGGVRHKKL